MILEPRCPGRGSFFCALGNEAVAVALLVDGQYLLCTGALTKSRAGTHLLPWPCVSAGAFDHRHACDARTRNVLRSGRSMHMVYFVNAGGTSIERAGAREGVDGRQAP
jgi:hypothetical protein